MPRKRPVPMTPPMEITADGEQRLGRGQRRAEARSRPTPRRTLDVAILQLAFELALVAVDDMGLALVADVRVGDDDIVLAVVACGVTMVSGRSIATRSIRDGPSCFLSVVSPAPSSFS